MKFRITVLTFFIGFITYAQSSIKGKVVDKEGIPLYGVSVVLKNTKYFSDFTGEFNVKYSGEYPVDIHFTYVGFNSQTKTLYKEGDGKNVLVQLLEPKSNTLTQVVVAASRKAEKKIETPVTIETFSSSQIKNGTAADFYNGLENIKETQFNAGSLLQKSVNTRGFGTPNNGRFLQLVDGAESTVPALNANIGNFMGLNELDVESVEVLPGTSSALYGANAFNGLLFMNSISPFKKQGVSAYYKRGVTNQNVAGTNFYDDFGLRLGVKFNKKIAAKLNVNYFSGTDWLADDQTNQGVIPGVFAKDQYHDGINSYGDENIKNIPGAAEIVNRTGYRELDLTDGKVKTIKLDASLHFKPTETFDIVIQQKMTIGTTAYMDTGTKYAFKDFLLSQSKVELKSKNFTSRSYATFNDAGNSYSLTRAALNLNNASKSDDVWFRDYEIAFSKFYNPSIDNRNEAYTASRKYADFNDKSGNTDLGDATGLKRLVPGTLAFQRALSKSQQDVDPKSGSKLHDQSAFANQDLNYNFRDLIKFAEIQIGGTYRLNYLNSEGTLFTDKDAPITYGQYGAYTQIEKQLLDERLKLTGSVRYDKVHGLDGNFSPRISSNLSLGEKSQHNLRASYQTGFRNPTSQDLYSGSDYGLITLLGSGVDNVTRYKENIVKDGVTYNFTGEDIYNKSYSYNSVLGFSTFLLSGGAIADAIGLLKLEKVDLVKPERVQSFELGYRATIAGISFDVNGYLNKYSDFIYSKRVVHVFYNDPTGFLGASALDKNDFKAYQVYTNANTSIETRGVGVGLDKDFGKFHINASYNFAQLMDYDTTSDPGFEPDFNTPKHKAKLSLGHPKVLKNFGFNTNLRWNSEYKWNSSFASGIIPSTVVVDAQINVTLPSLKGMFKIGANNMLGKDYYQVIGAGLIGQQYYASFTYNL